MFGHECPICKRNYALAEPVFKLVEDEDSTQRFKNGDLDPLTRELTPYFRCSDGCGVWYQDPLPPKKFEAEEEKGADGRSNGHNQDPTHLAAAANLAHAFAVNWIKRNEPTIGSEYRVIDIGCKYPYFAHTLKKRHSMNAFGIDGMDFDQTATEPILTQYQAELDIPMLMVDFEKLTYADVMKHSGGRFDAVSMIHVFEHMYDPVTALKFIRSLMYENCYFLIRLPAADVLGHDQHLSDRHYPIHPFFHTDSSIRWIVEKAGGFEIADTYPLKGVGARDFILRSI